MKRQQDVNKTQISDLQKISHKKCHQTNSEPLNRIEVLSLVLRGSDPFYGLPIIGPNLNRQTVDTILCSRYCSNICLRYVEKIHCVNHSMHSWHEISSRCPPLQARYLHCNPLECASPSGHSLRTCLCGLRLCSFKWCSVRAVVSEDKGSHGKARPALDRLWYCLDFFDILYL